jgi:hypothetical protein
VPWENNIAQRNLHVVAYPQPPAGQCRFDQNGLVGDSVQFDVINTLSSSSSVDVKVTAGGLPETAQAWLVPGALAGRWSSLDGLAPEVDGRLRVLRFPARLYGIRLNPNEARSVTLEVRAPVNSRFTVGLAEFVRGNLVGGNSYQRPLPGCPLTLPMVIKAGSPTPTPTATPVLNMGLDPVEGPIGTLVAVAVSGQWTPGVQVFVTLVPHGVAVPPPAGQIVSTGASVTTSYDGSPVVTQFRVPNDPRLLGIQPIQVVVHRADWSEWAVEPFVIIDAHPG